MGIGAGMQSRWFFLLWHRSASLLYDHNENPGAGVGVQCSSEAVCWASNTHAARRTEHTPTASARGAQTQPTTVPYSTPASTHPTLKPTMCMLQLLQARASAAAAVCAFSICGRFTQGRATRGGRARQPAGSVQL